MISTPGDHLPPEVVYTKAFLVAIKLASLPTIRSSKAVDKEHSEIMSCESSMCSQSVGQVIIHDSFTKIHVSTAIALSKRLKRSIRLLICFFCKYENDRPRLQTQLPPCITEPFQSFYETLIRLRPFNQQTIFPTLKSPLHHPLLLPHTTP